jgi:hypothetical protein
MTNQELFNECVGHVIAQRLPAFEPGGPVGSCCYLSSSGLSCAVGGPLLRRGLYHPEIESAFVAPWLYYLTMNEAETALAQALRAWGVDPTLLDLLAEIQSSHDDAARDSHNLLKTVEASDRAEQHVRLFQREFKARARAVALNNQLDDSIVEGRVQEPA